MKQGIDGLKPGAGKEGGTGGRKKNGMNSGGWNFVHRG